MQSIFPEDDFAGDEAQFDEDGLLEEVLGLSDIDRRAALERDGRIAAEITVDLQDRGPLYRYVSERRQQAAAALRVLIETRPDTAENIAAIIAAQASFEEFRKVTRFIHAGLYDGEQAARIIEEDYGHEPPDDGDLIQEPEPSWRKRRR